MQLRAETCPCPARCSCRTRRRAARPSWIRGARERVRRVRRWRWRILWLRGFASRPLFKLSLTNPMLLECWGTLSQGYCTT
eukprot:scaffold4430_cov162-Pinguiococcus_pyrenoidosus.AAC.1